MSCRNLNQDGFTITELLVVIALVSIMFVSFGSFFNNYLKTYPAYQSDASNFSELAQQSQRISNVVRGIVDISNPANDELEAYAYFSPSDTYTSVVRYYLSADGKALMVDVTRMTANPPIGTPITASKRTYTVISNYYKPPATNLFVYYDSAGTVLTPPIANQHVINSIGINLAEPISHSNKGQQLNISVSLRNRKVNL